MSPSTICGPKEPIPDFPDDLRALAIAELWDESGEGKRWRRSITNLRSILDPHPWHGTEPLFDIQTTQ